MAARSEWEDPVRQVVLACAEGQPEAAGVLTDEALRQARLLLCDAIRAESDVTIDAAAVYLAAWLHWCRWLALAGQLGALPEHQVLHFAGHSRQDLRNPGRSLLRLADGDLPPAAGRSFTAGLGCLPAHRAVVRDETTR
jgi:hypothetical protein